MQAVSLSASVLLIAAHPLAAALGISHLILETVRRFRCLRQSVCLGISAQSSREFNGLGPVLARVRDFLPELRASNVELEELARNDPTSVDIENIDSNQEHYIEMVCFVRIITHLNISTR
jgi:hypothetical protein